MNATGGVTVRFEPPFHAQRPIELTPAELRRDI